MTYARQHLCRHCKRMVWHGWYDCPEKPKDLGMNPYPFQREGVNFLLADNRRYLADRMRPRASERRSRPC